MPLVKINSATFQDLVTLPGVSHTLANRIINFRQTRTITADNIQTIRNLRVGDSLLNAISFDEDASYHGSNPRALANPQAGGHSHSQSSDDNVSVVLENATARSQPRTISPPPVTHGFRGSHGTRQSRAPHCRSSGSTRRVRHSASSQNSDSDDSWYPNRRPGHGSQKKSFRPPPRELEFDGKSDWTPFQRRFTNYASEKDWTGATSLTNLGWCLKGKAGDFYNRVLDREPTIDFTRMMHKLIKRFGERELRDVIVMKFTQARQTSDEDIFEWADRVQHLAHRAYKHLPQGEEEQMAIMRFGQGLRDKRLADYIANANIASMETAIDRAQSFQHNTVAIHGPLEASAYDSHQYMSQGPAVRVNAVGRASRYDQPPRRSVAFSPRPHASTKSPDSSPAVSTSGHGNGTHRQIGAGSGSSSLARMEAKLDKIAGIDTKMDRMVLGISGVQDKLDEMCEGLRRLTTAMLSPRNRRSPSPKRNNECFNCGEEGHFARDCPKAWGNRDEDHSHGEQPESKQLVPLHQDSSLNMDGSAHQA